MTLAFRFASSRLSARCWSPDDAPSFRALLDRNDAHLRPFIPWMRDEPQTLDQTRQRLATYERRFLAEQDFRYALRDHDESLVGELMLSTRSGQGSREVGYLLDHAATGRGYATEAAAMGVRVAMEIDQVQRVELHCSPQNLASVRIAQKLGFELEAVHPRHFVDSEGTLQDSMIWVLTEDIYPDSAAAAFELQVFARDGRRLL